MTDNDIATELNEQKDLLKRRNEAKQLLEKKKQELLKQTKKQRRLLLEQKFLSAVIAMADEGDIREKIGAMNIRYGVTWRHFIDKRHRVIFRSLESLDMRSVEERMKIIEKEIYEDAGNETEDDRLSAEIDPDWDRVRGVPESAADQQFKKKLQDRSRGAKWFERELEAAGVLKLIGGLIYLREIAKIAEESAIPPEYAAPGFATRLLKGKYEDRAPELEFFKKTGRKKK